MSDAPMDNMLELKAVVRRFEQAGETLEVLRGVDLTVGAGELVALVGPSGAGKSTLLHIAGLLERPTEGRVSIGGTDVSGLDDGKRTEVRRRAIGFVYQFHHLLPEFSARENIVLPQMIAGVAKSTARQRADELLRMVGLEQRGTHRPARLSGGEQQRVAIARALANAPSLLIADEPTGNLDPHTAEHVFAMLSAIVRQAKVGALVATHNLDLARRMDRVLEMRDGRLVEYDPGELEPLGDPASLRAETSGS
ncbi:ABC transporter ATP-binding protein [Azospirillum picis]|uniref:Lipoprotein-releasing system ATP-binding protein n=1 Tax=Azospirillum picis TaxID=488438 RepID=A0ABU0MIQ5_9PROT|nr:ABC transporter ATP-binding protein [Azospirillum picis]MBP2299533.1 lipoprotein-releasing system ATP-binding protein [Azospirillum picis]MDQ0533340.1 lipoprotein-releasing system ATP-binding protein [Azospirillum picis]